ncbi:MAG: hypothetical protein Q9169_008222 [Polycauliona sp. 2 TL-2023]
MADYPCSYCSTEVHDARGQRAHDQEYPRYCAEHNMCHRSWHGHVRRFEHKQCTVRGCPSQPRFDSDDAFLRHFNRYHAGSGGAVKEAENYDDYGGYDSDYAK